MITEKEFAALSKRNELTETIVNTFIKDHQDINLGSRSLGIIFEELFIDDEGYSDDIPIKELEKIHKSFNVVGGTGACGWSRATGSTYLGCRYIVINKHENSRVYSVKADGKRTEPHQYTKRSVDIEIMDEATELVEMINKNELSDDFDLRCKTLLHNLAEINKRKRKR